MNNASILEAIEFAAWAHRDQMRKTSDLPYIVHPFHVHSSLLLHGVTPALPRGDAILIAALLHDTIEDNPEEVTRKLIRTKFGRPVADIVWGVTLDPNDPDKRKSRQKILTLGWEVRIVKIADILSNTVSKITAIENHGLNKVQKFFKQPIKDRVAMESDFLEHAAQPGDTKYVYMICNSAQRAIKKLGRLAKN